MKSIKSFALICFLFVLSLPLAIAQTVDTISVYSKKMGREIKNVVILPDSYTKNKKDSYPVIYLLHGYGGRYDTWVSHTKKSLPQEANRWNVIFVCPDGQNSWYWDSPIDPRMQFETYVSNELITEIDTKYRTIVSNKGRAVTGFSMGGHGGLWLGINHPDVFGACGSLSGGVDIRPFSDNWDMKKWLGTYKQNPQVWEQHTVINQLDKIEPKSLAIIIDCGVNDFFYQVNEELHRALLYRNIPHDYITRPGGHTHDYWNGAIDYQIQFFYKFLQQK